MDLSPLKPNDDRVKYVTAKVRGKMYEYMIGQPLEGPPLATIFLIHGFPDLPHGWRNQVPYLQALGFRVVAPSMIGYAGTDAPQNIREYTLKSVSDDIKDLAAQIVGDGQIILGGHDWGGAVVWRVVLYHPKLIKAVFAVCTPYSAPQTAYYDTETIVKHKLPNFTYQLQFQGPEVETRIQDATQLRQFFSALYAGVGPNNEIGFDTGKGVLFDVISTLGTPRLLPEPELAHYVKEYLRQPDRPLRGPLNWYRTRRLNYEDELPLAEAGAGKVEMPALFIAASRDAALPPAMSAGMEKFVTDLTRAEVDASHWALTQRGPEVNAILGKWLNKVLDGQIKASL